MTLTDVAWLAGLLEGEGHFGYTPPRRMHMRTNAPGVETKARASIKVTAGSTDRDIVERVASLIGGNIIERKVPAGSKPFWTTQVSGVKAQEAMERVRPFMGRRRTARIDELLAKTNLSHHPRA